METTKPITIFIKSLVGKTWSHDVNAHDTVESLQLKIQDKEGIPTGVKFFQQLLFDFCS